VLPKPKNYGRRKKRGRKPQQKGLTLKNIREDQWKFLEEKREYSIRKKGDEKHILGKWDLKL